MRTAVTSMKSFIPARPVRPVAEQRSRASAPWCTVFVAMAGSVSVDQCAVVFRLRAEAGSSLELITSGCGGRPERCGAAR